MSDMFYGWYFRCQSDASTMAVIPAVHISGNIRSCSIQVITEKGAWNKTFPIQQFRINRKKGIMQIGENLFSKKGIRLKIETKDLRVQGLLRFGPFAEPKYDIMGPFRFIPGMECRHSVYSMEHSVGGSLMLNGENLHFDGGKGYMEGDSGTSFPEKYIWTQHFLDHGSVMLAAATIPLTGLCFRGTVGILRWKGREIRFATYLGASVVKMEENELEVRQGKYRLNVRLLEQKASPLHAPKHGEMTRMVLEDPSCRVEYTLRERKRVLFKVAADRAAFECECIERKK